MDNERITEELEEHARFCSYLIGAHFKGRTNTQLEKILVRLATTRDSLINESLIDNVLIIKMINSFIDGIRGKKPPGN